MSRRASPLRDGAPPPPPPAPSAPALDASPTLLDSVWASIATPGAGPGLVAAVNGAIAALLAALAYLYVGGFGSAHVAVLAALAVGLAASFNWFIAMQRGAQ